MKPKTRVYWAFTYIHMGKAEVSIHRIRATARKGRAYHKKSGCAVSEITRVLLADPVVPKLPKLPKSVVFGGKVKRVSTDKRKLVLSVDSITPIVKTPPVTGKGA